jgi:hypothetical protein
MHKTSDHIAIDWESCARTVAGMRTPQYIGPTTERSKNGGHILAVYRCPLCSNRFTARPTEIKHGKRISCGCYHSRKGKPGTNTIDLTGETSGYLYYVQPTAKRTKDGLVIWLCLCLYEGCGKFCEISSQSYKRGVLSCGCYQRKNTIKWAVERTARKRGIDLQSILRGTKDVFK